MAIKPLTTNVPSKNDATEAQGLVTLTVEDRLRIQKSLQTDEPRNKALLEEIVFILQTKLATSGIKVHDIEMRIKDAASVIDKCERKSIQDHNQLVDIVGARVISLFRSDMAGVAKVLSSNFDVLQVDDKIIEGDPLGYQSTHYVCKLPARYSGPRYENTSGIQFEIQVRTLCMHAWAAVSHYLDYKGDWDVPDDLKRALSALGGLFYVADNEFEQFYAARQRSKVEADKPSEADRGQELNLDTLTSYLNHKFKNRKQSANISKLVRELKSNGYQTIEDVDMMVDRGDEAFRAYERAHPPSGGSFVAEGVVRVTDRIVNGRPSKFPRELNFAHLVKPGRDRES